MDVELVNLQALLSPDEIAAAVLRLCLPESGSINGQAIEIGGDGI